MAASISTSATQDLSAYNQQQIQDFENGKITITKQDLTAMVSSEVSKGEEPSATLVGLLSSYNTIDTTGNGITYSELEKYKSSSSGLLNSLGLNADSLKEQLNKMALTLLGGDSSSSSSGSIASLLDSNNSSSLLSGSTSSSSSSLSSLFDSEMLSNSSNAYSLLGELSSSSSSSTSGSSSTSSIESLLQNYSSSSSSSDTLSLANYLT